MLADMTTLEHAGFQAQSAEAFAYLKAVASGFHQNDVLRGQFGHSPFEQGFQ